MSILPLVEQAMMSGYGAEQILRFLSSQLPELQEGVKQAKSAGFDANKILRYLSYNTPRVNKEKIQQQKNANDRFLSGIGLKTKQEKDASRNKALGALLGVGAAGALGAYNAFKKTPQVGSPSPMSSAPVSLSKSTISPAPPLESSEYTFPNNELSSGINIGQSSQEQQQMPQTSISELLRGTNKNPTSLTPNLETSKNSIDIIRQLGLDSKINQLKKEGNNIDQIYSGLLPHITKEQKEALKSHPKPLIEMVKDYVFSGSEGEDLAQDVIPSSKKGGLINDLQRDFEEGEKEQEKLFSTPEGKIGTFKSIRNNKGLLEADGKLHQLDLESAIESPVSEKDLSELHEDLIKGIEKETGEEVSRNVNWAGYDPVNNSLSYLPHGGGLYIYNDIPSEDVERLTNILNKRKTSGENFIGAWKEGTKSPIGSAMSSLIRKLQSERGGKGKEYAQKFETVYHYLEPAIKAAKKKKKKK